MKFILIIFAIFKLTYFSNGAIEHLDFLIEISQLNLINYLKVDHFVIMKSVLILKFLLQKSNGEVCFILQKMD